MPQEGTEGTGEDVGGTVASELAVRAAAVTYLGIVMGDCGMKVGVEGSSGVRTSDGFGSKSAWPCPPSGSS